MRRRRTASARNTGSVVLLALIASIIVSGLAYQLHLHVFTHRVLSSYFARGQRSNQLRRVEAVRLTSSERGCETQSISVTSKLSQDWFLCSLGRAPFFLSQAIAQPSMRVDYNAIFGNKTPCPGTRTLHDRQVFTAPEAEYNCLLSEALTGSIAVIENILIRDLEIVTQGAQAITTIATPGSLTVYGKLQLRGPALLIAGGDITLPSLVSVGSTPIAVTLLSAHGNINVGNLSGALSVLGMGRHLLSIPPSPSSDQFPMPPFRSVGLLGIRRKE